MLANCRLLFSLSQAGDATTFGDRVCFRDALMTARHAGSCFELAPKHKNKI
jgi:hypothetical protein